MGYPFDSDEIGTYRPQPKCSHSASNYILLDIQWVAIPFKYKTLEKFFRGFVNLIGYSSKQDSYSHDCFFIDVKCQKSGCGKQTVFLMEYERNGTSIRNGYYRTNAKHQKRINIPKGSHIKWSGVKQIYSKYQYFGDYDLANNNCQTWMRRLWPEVKGYVQRAKRNQE